MHVFANPVTYIDANRDANLLQRKHQYHFQLSLVISVHHCFGRHQALSYAACIIVFLDSFPSKGTHGDVHLCSHLNQV